MGEQKVVIMEDTNIVAYLNYKGFKFAPFRKGVGDRISFHVYGDVDKILAEFYSGDSMVNVQEFISCLKKVRSSMFLLKGMDPEQQS